MLQPRFFDDERVIILGTKNKIEQTIQIIYLEI